MKSKKSNIEKSFKTALVILVLVIITLATLILDKKHDSGISGFLIGLALLSTGVLGVIGSIQGLKGLKESKSFKKVIALAINFGIVILFVFLILANVIDLYKALG